MSVRPILRWPDRRLRQPAEPVGTIDADTRTVWEDMIDTMDALPGVGLAAPQIGVMRRLAVVFTDVHRLRVRHEFEGLWAASVQHQIDHLEGRMYFDRLSRLKRERLLKRARKGAA